MILAPRRFLITALAVFAAAFFLGIGSMLSGSAAPPRTRASDHPRAASRSIDDSGFSITLASPRVPYLTGRQTIAIEPTIPSGDVVAQVDIFLDGKLSHTMIKPPFSWEADFGEVITRHTIVVTAVTRAGRRARVSFISRSSDLTDVAARSVVIVPAVVRDADGRLVDGLSVSDFTLLENGARQRIVHFDRGPGPVSVAVVARTEGKGREALPALRSAGAAFIEPLPTFHALGVLRKPDGSVPRRVDFTYNHDLFGQRLADGGEEAAGPAEQLLAEDLAAAALGLKSRPGVRVVLLLFATEPPRFGPPAPPATDPDAPRRGRERAGRDDHPEPATLAGAVDALREARAMLQVIAVVPGAGPEDEGPYAALREASEESGGEFVIIPSPAGIENVGRALSDTLLHQYLLSYSPEDPDRQGRRSIDLKVRRADFEVKARKSYAPEPEAKP